MSHQGFYVGARVRYAGKPTLGTIRSIPGEPDNPNGVTVEWDDGRTVTYTGDYIARHLVVLTPPAEQGVDMVNHPPHYARFENHEPIDVIEEWGLNWHLGNVVKYIARCDHKENPVQDLEKARMLLDREIARRKMYREIARRKATT